MLQTSDFDYVVPHELIAQEPLLERSSARLLVIDKKSGAITHALFNEIGRYLDPGDLLVLNDTKVLPMRLNGTRASSGGKIEILLVEPVEKSPKPLKWLSFTRSGGKIKEGEALKLNGGAIATLIERRGEDGDVVEFKIPEKYAGDIFAYLNDAGVTPLPPYIERGKKGVDTPQDREFYQTVYARVPGASAAPTAGMHFTQNLLDALRAKGVGTAEVTLHVGPGTFRPVKEDDLTRHHMHSETYSVSEAAAQAVNETHLKGGKIIAVGTTVVRTIEAACNDGMLRPGEGRTNLFIYPPFNFQLTDALVTNFHLPKSTLLMLVSAFAGRERILAAYNEAVRLKYRFFSYGDAMLII